MLCETSLMATARYYLAIEVVDFTLYFRSYIGVFSVVFNILADYLEARFPIVRLASVFPIFLAAVDSMEDSLQVPTRLPQFPPPLQHRDACHTPSPHPTVRASSTPRTLMPTCTSEKAINSRRRGLPADARLAHDNAIRVPRVATGVSCSFHNQLLLNRFRLERPHSDNTYHPRSLQVATVLTFMQDLGHQPWWPKLVGIASSVNRFKWGCVYVGLLGLIIEMLFVVYVIATAKDKVVGRSKDGKRR